MIVQIVPMGADAGIGMFPCVDGLDRDFLMEARAIRGVWVRGRIVWSVFVFARPSCGVRRSQPVARASLQVLSITALPRSAGLDDRVRRRL